MEGFYANRMMTPNGMMLPVSNINNSSNNSTAYLSPTPYAIPLRSPTTQFTMTPGEMMMSHHHPYGTADYTNTTAPFAQHSWNNNHSEYCFSGCCQPPPYPSTPNMYPSYPATLSTPSTSTATPFASQQQQIHSQLLQPQNVWVPVKQEEGVSDELLVKVETKGEVEEMQVEKVDG